MSFSHAKYQFSGVLTASSPDRSLVIHSWICSQVFSFCFSCLTAPAGEDHVENMSYFSMCRFFSGSAGQDGDPRAVWQARPPAQLTQSPQKVLQKGRITTAWWTITMSVSSPWCHTHYLPHVSPTFNLTHVYHQMDPRWISCSVFMSPSWTA